MTHDFSSSPRASSTREDGDDTSPRTPPRDNDRSNTESSPPSAPGRAPSKVERPAQPANRRSLRDRGDVTIPMPKPPKELQD